jgi:hypothetical protein
MTAAMSINQSSHLALDMMQIDADETNLRIASIPLGTVMSGSNSANAISEDLMLNLVPVVTVTFRLHP